MKQPIRLLISAIFLCQICIAQDTSKSVDSAWNEFKIELHRRHKRVSNIADALSQLNNVTPKEIKHIRTISANFIAYTDTLRTLNRFSISHAYSMSAQLSQALERLHEKLSTRTDATEILVQLEGTANRFYVVSRDFNEACVAANRIDLFFGHGVRQADLKSVSDTSKRTTSALKNKG